MFLEEADTGRFTVPTNMPLSWWAASPLLMLFSNWQTRSVVGRYRPLALREITP